jgi:hypothetical protein
MISYTISVYNEIQEISSLLAQLTKIISKEDEIVVVQTYRDQSEVNTELFKQIKNVIISYANTYQTFHFQQKFADLKNYVNSLATKTYIINLDADEMVTEQTLSLWKNAIQSQKADLYYVPRINIVDSYTLQDMQKYHWNVNSNGWINWPDYQPRIFINNNNLKWAGDVHETMTGAQQAIVLPANPSWAMIHYKHILRQREQNSLYEQINREKDNESHL